MRESHDEGRGPARWGKESKTSASLVRKDGVTWKVKIWETEIPKDEQGVGRGRWKTATLMEKL